MIRSGIYRTALQVPQSLIAALGDTDLNELMRELLAARARRCGCPDASVNTDIDARDDGCDAWSAQPTIEDLWLGSTDTCWQFKAGRAGEPAKLTEEVAKPIPRRTLQEGGRFVVVASGSTSGEAGVRRRREKLRGAAKHAGIPSQNIEVFGSEKLAKWCNQHPAVAARWAGAPEGLQRFDDWERSDLHRIDYQETSQIAAAFSTTLAHLDFDTQRETDRIHHLHIRGQPGVGKTRFALELCRRAPWRDTVIYVRQADDIRLSQLIDSAAEAQDVLLTIVADEVQPEQLEPLRDSVGRADGRVQLITIGSCRSRDEQRIRELSIEPLDVGAMREVVSGWYPEMPPEHVDFVTRFADGYVRLGRLTADAVADNPAATVPNLLDRSGIRGLLDRMLGDGDRRCLYAVAVLTHVGWEGDREQEGQAVASHLNLDWNDVRYQVERFHSRMGIAPRGGRYRYISPEPLGIYLAHEAWETHRDLLRSLPEVLPSEEAKEACYKRLESLSSNPQAQAFSRDQLGFFFRIDDFVELHAARRWSAFSAADPDVAARNLRYALTDSSLENRRRITFGALGAVVRRLARIAWRATGFHDAATALALLAEAENQTWGNGASSAFLRKYQVNLAATSLPYLQRLDTLDELAAQGRPALVGLVVSALSRVAYDGPSDVISAPSDRAPDPEWRASSAQEYVHCIAAAIGRLHTIAAEREPKLKAALLDAAKEVSPLLGWVDASSSVTKLFDRLRDAYPELREPLRKQVGEVMRRNKERLPADHLQTLSRLDARFEDPSLGGRLRQHVGLQPWERDGRPDFTSLAAELLAAPDSLAREWSWLTSGGAAAAWELGTALAEADPCGELAKELPRFPGSGRDLRVVCGYVAAQRKTLGDGWYERWVLTQFGREPQPLGLLMEVVWRCGVTERVAVQVAELLRGTRLSPALVGQLKYGDWTHVSADALQSLLRAMIDMGHGKTAISMLHRRMEQADAETELWQPMAMELVKDLDLIRSREMPNHYWQKVAALLIADRPREIAAAIFRAHAQPEERPKNWFLQHERAVVNVLIGCVSRDPDGVWQELIPYLWPPQEAVWFVSGFPAGVIERMPADDVLAWVAAAPAEQVPQRAMLLSRLTDKLLTDESLAARIIDVYGDKTMVAEAFFSRQVSGGGLGPVSSRWGKLAQELDHVATETNLAGLCRWAQRYAGPLREMVKQERQREEEEDLLVRSGA